MSDRVIVMYEGEIAGEFSGQIDRAAVGRLMGGSTAEAATRRECTRQTSLTLRIERRPKPGGSIRYRLGRSRSASIALDGVRAGRLRRVARSVLHGRLEQHVWARPYGVQYRMILTTPLMLTGLAAAIPLRIGLWNIGGDGQLFLGAWGGLRRRSPVPAPKGAFLIPLMFDRRRGWRSGLVAAPGAGPRLPRNVNEIISTLMFNFIAGFWVIYWAGQKLGRAAVGRRRQVTSRPRAVDPLSRSSSVTT